MDMQDLQAARQAKRHWYEQTAKNLLTMYNITACYKCRCRRSKQALGHSRSHAHVKKQSVCLAAKPVGYKSFFVLLHEIGHIMAPHGNHRYRFVQEHAANQWAYAELKKLGLPLKRKVKKSFDDYVRMQIGRASRRGANNPWLTRLERIY